MPVPLRTTYHKAEAKYNVTTEFPALGLHSAAANGNVGLVEYALDHGQPVNSVLDGVLPLHAACAGGNVQIVKVLIDHGADVNAPRLPRRYSNDKNRDTSAPIVGSSGSTPLHFAAANGNTDVVKLLLLHGAHADRMDKHGITPETLAKQNGWIECAGVLKDWILNKDRDLREREGGIDDPSASQYASPVPEPDMSTGRRRLHVKHSIDTALNMLQLKSSSSNLTESYKRSHQPSSPTPPASPLKPMGEYSFHPTDPNSEAAIPAKRRPSLPHIHPHSDELVPPPKISASVSATSSTRRPRSAGTGAERSDNVYHPVYGRGGSGRKLGSKYSLMNIFRKGQDGSSEAMPSSTNYGSTTTLPLASSPPPMSTLPPRASNVDLNDTLHGNSAPSGSAFSRVGFRFHRGSDASIKSQQPSQDRSSPLINRKPSSTLRSPRAALPLAVDLHNAIAQQQQQKHGRERSRSSSSRVPGPATITNDDSANLAPNSSPVSRLTHLRAQGHKRDRSGSNGSIAVEMNQGNRSAVFFDDDAAAAAVGVGAGELENPKPPTRPGILRAHNRSSSSGQGSGSSTAFRALRFDSASSGGDWKGRESPYAVLSLRPSTSTGSLSKSAPSDIPSEPKSAPATISSQVQTPTGNIIEGDETNDDTERGNNDGEYEYGHPLDHESKNIPTVSTPYSLPKDTLLMRQRGVSFTSSQSSLSPLLPGDAYTPDDITSVVKEFPFSIRQPPALPETPPSTGGQEHLRVPLSIDGRGRGDSLSSTSTADSRNKPQLSSGGTTSGSTESFSVVTPAHDHPLTLAASPNQDSKDLVAINELESDQDGQVGVHQVAATSINERRAHSPLDIDISTISSHAQAEALVQRARQEVLELAGTQEVASGTATSSRTPLSARLAAYGESLALERKLREQKAEELRQQSMSNASSPPPLIMPTTTAPTTYNRVREGVERQHSLESKAGPGKMRVRTRDPRRPSTADSALSPRSGTSTFAADPSGLLQPTKRTFSGSGHLRPALSVDKDLRSRVGNELYKSPTPSPSHPISSREGLSSDGIAAGTFLAAKRRTEDETLSRVSSLDGVSTDTEMGPPLQRVSTTPLAGNVPQRGKREQVKSAKKLQRMGIPPNEQAGRTQPQSLTPKRFGIKSLMQTLKGKP